MTKHMRINVNFFYLLSKPWHNDVFRIFSVTSLYFFGCTSGQDKKNPVI